MNKLKITIGIPAFNEQANIGFLLKSIKSQNLKRCNIQNIIVASDGSTDNTVKIVKNFKSKKILLFNNSRRKGLAAMLNQITSASDTEILILLNADTILQNNNFIEKIVEPIIKNKVDLASSNVQELRPITFFEKILFISTKIKNFTFERYNNGNNVYTCRGLARAFSKNLYKKIYFDSSIGEDAYSYFYCILNGYKYKFVKDAKVYFRLPNNLSDHINQSLRFFKSQSLMIEKFGLENVKTRYKIPKQLLLESISIQFFRSPIYTLFYIYLLLILKIFFLIHGGKSKDMWKTPTSSKFLK